MSVINVANEDRVFSNSCHWLAVVCFRAIQHLALEECHKLTGRPDGPFGSRLAHIGLLIVGNVAQVHYTGQCASKAVVDELPRLLKNGSRSIPV